jgi:hypothetical protein
MGETILEAAVRRAVPLLDAESADQQILKLLRQIGELERENAALRAENWSLRRKDHRLEACATTGI